MLVVARPSVASRDADRGEAMEKRLRTLSVTAEFRRRFEAEKEIINCLELTEADLITPKRVEQCMRSDVPQTTCFPIVATRPGTRYETPSVRGHGVPG